MENDNKKQQHFYRPSNSSKPCHPSDSGRKNSDKKDLQSNKPISRHSRRRDQQQQQQTARNEYQRNPNKSQQNLQGKLRGNVDKRPRGRPRLFGENNANATSNTNDDSASCSGLDAIELKNGTLARVNEKKVKQSYNDCELNSAYAVGSKKHNLSHLLNFYYAPRESEYNFGKGGLSVSTRHQNGNNATGRKPKYNKERFLQANFQFVVKPNAQPKLDASPDALIDWDLIEQINVHATEEPQCPICLDSPKAAKLTRCGHIYCWPCMLHYLALTDKSWRKCPICYEAVHTNDLKSTIIIQKREKAVGEYIKFVLMCRKKNSMLIQKYEMNQRQHNEERFPNISEDATFTKFLIANRLAVTDIIDREKKELLENNDNTCPEYVFVQEALNLLIKRGELLESDTVYDEQEQTVHIEAVQKTESDNQSSVDVGRETMSTTSEAETSNTESSSEIKYYYFYQSSDGLNAYLHPLNVKMLQCCYGALDNAPPVINARVLQREYHSMDEEHRRKFTCLGHLPLTCQFSVVEVILTPPTVTTDIVELFKEELDHRKHERKRRELEELKRERRINEINDRQMGKLISSTAHLNLESSSEFPLCGFEEALGNIDVTQNNHTGTSYSAITIDGGNNELKKKEFWPELPASSLPSAYDYDFQKLSSWGKRMPSTVETNAKPTTSSSASIATDDDAPNLVDQAPKHTTLSDVLAEAMFQNQQNNVVRGKQHSVAIGNGNNNNNNNGTASVTSAKKNKKSKKMLPLFSTGMSFNGN